MVWLPVWWVYRFDDVAPLLPGACCCALIRVKASAPVRDKKLGIISKSRKKVFTKRVIKGIFAEIAGDKRKTAIFLRWTV